jgi:hypothetical protein
MAVMRVYSTEDGESHWADDVELAMTSGSVGEETSQLFPANGLLYRRIPQDYERDWHPAVRRQWLVPLINTVEMTTSDGETRRLKPGDLCLVEDTSGKGHRTQCVDGRDHVTLFVPVP